MEHTGKVAILGHRSITLGSLKKDALLVVGTRRGRRRRLTLLGRNRGVSLDQLGRHTTRRLKINGRRRVILDVEVNLPLERSRSTREQRVSVALDNAHTGLGNAGRRSLDVQPQL